MDRHPRFRRHCSHKDTGEDGQPHGQEKEEGNGLRHGDRHPGKNPGGAPANEGGGAVGCRPAAVRKAETTGDMHGLGPVQHAGKLGAHAARRRNRRTPNKGTAW